MDIINKQTISEQVILLLHERINTGQYTSGEKLPSESELSSELNVSRASIRSALAALASAGLISRKQGDGTYVTAKRPSLTSMASSVWEFKQIISAMGRKCSVRGLEVVQRKSTVEEETILELTPGEEVVSIKRFFYADENPIIYSINIIPASHILKSCKVDRMDLTKGLDDFVGSYCDFKITGVNVELNAVLGEEELLKLLDIKRNVALLKLVEIFHGKNDQPLVFTNNYIKDFTLPIHVLRPWL
jgi:GntR family transcriptional regulator